MYISGTTGELRWTPSITTVLSGITEYTMHMVVFDSAGNTGSVDVVVPVKFPNPFATLA